MEQRLAEAARVGDVMALHRIMEEDPEILVKESLTHSADSALHIAARQGKAEFVKQIVSLMPSLATATNQKGLIPQHMASAQGHVETVKELLKSGPDDDEVKQCLVKEDDGWTPLHHAVFRGRLEVVKELMSHCPECVEEVTAKGETVLHLAGKANKIKVVETIKKLPNFQSLLKAKDINGKTAYELAATKIKPLVRLDKGKEEKDEIKEDDSTITVEVEEYGNDHCDEGPENREKQAASAEFKNTILLVATLIITLTYQGLANPPSTMFQPGIQIDWRCLSMSSFLSSVKSFPSYEYIRDCPAYTAAIFLVFNSLIFTLSIFFLLWGLRGDQPLIVMLLRLLASYLVINYCMLLDAFTYYAAYATGPICWLSFAFLFYLLYHEYREYFPKGRLRNILKKLRRGLRIISNCIPSVV